MAIRALTPEALAREAGLHPDTVYNALRSDWIRLATARAIAGALQRTAPVEGLADLVASSPAPTPA
jgi:lambda repressor-like predicted transcriptional regulator